MEKIIIAGNEVLYSAYKLKEDFEFQNILKSTKLKNFLKNIDSDILVVLWGDGTMLEAIHENYTRQRKFLGINYGNKGFLLNENSILDYAWVFEERQYPLLEMCIWDRLCAIALNEFDIKAWDGKMLNLDLQVETHHIELLWDGIIVSTPLGSTGYNSSLWGAILPHDISSYIVTPKAAWKPKGLSPFILSDNKKLQIQTQWRKSPVELYADGRLIEKYDQENISLILKKSEISVSFLISWVQYNSWDSRVLEEQGFMKNTK